jgi:hypothetical protein
VARKIENFLVQKRTRHRRSWKQSEGETREQRWRMYLWGKEAVGRGISKRGPSGERCRVPRLERAVERPGWRQEQPGESVAVAVDPPFCFCVFVAKRGHQGMWRSAPPTLKAAPMMPTSAIVSLAWGRTKRSCAQLGANACACRAEGHSCAGP